jgi:hypothetical protein
MSFLASISPEAASRLVVVIAVGALTTAGAGAGAATLLTGSPSPSVWLAAYGITSESPAGRSPEPRCSSAAAQAISSAALRPVSSQGKATPPERPTQVRRDRRKRRSRDLVASVAPRQTSFRRLGRSR